MRLTNQDVLNVSGQTGHRPDMVEKVIHLLNLLDAMNSHPYLRGKWVLKGGTALNVFELDLPRLSVDIDVNYIGALDLATMENERPSIIEAMFAVFGRENFNVIRSPREHAGGKWRLRYQSYTGQSGNLEVDLNFMLRQPLWDFQVTDSRMLGTYQAESIPVLDIHEIAAGKLAALMTRHKARDLYDCAGLFQSNNLDMEKLRVGFVVYGAMSRTDWRTISISDIAYDRGDINSQLLPTLDSAFVQDVGDSSDYGSSLVETCKAGVGALLPFNESEQAFLNAIQDKGEVISSLLTVDPVLQKRINNQPMLKWKAQNVRKHKGLN